MYLSLGILLDKADTFEAKLQPHADGFIASVEPTGFSNRSTIQAVDSDVLRRLAAALVEAADLADRFVFEKAVA